MKLPRNLGDKKIGARILSVVIMITMVIGTLSVLPTINMGAETPKPTPDSWADHLVISEIYYDTPSTDDETLTFVELYNLIPSYVLLLIVFP